VVPEIKKKNPSFCFVTVSSNYRSHNRTLNNPVVLKLRHLYCAQPKMIVKGGNKYKNKGYF
jgi:hypothetical protein